MKTLISNFDPKVENAPEGEEWPCHWTLYDTATDNPYFYFWGDNGLVFENTQTGIKIEFGDDDSRYTKDHKENMYRYFYKAFKYFILNGGKL